MIIASSTARTVSGASRSVTYNAPVAVILMGGWSKQQDVSRMNDISQWDASFGELVNFGGTHEYCNL